MSFSDSKQDILTNNKKRSRRRNSPSKLLTQNERYIKNLSSQALSNDEVRLLSRGLKFISTPPVLSSKKFLLKDFDNFAKTMRLKYIFADKRKTSAHRFHVKSTQQPPVQNSVALENHLEETKLKLASTVFRPQIDNISAKKEMLFAH